MALHSSGGRPAVVQLSERGTIVVESLVAGPGLALPASIAGGGRTTVLGAASEVTTRTRSISIAHLPPAVQAALAAELDGPLSLVGSTLDEVLPSVPTARTLDRADALSGLPDVPGGILTAALQGGPVPWVAVQHPPSAEGDHCTALLVRAGDRVVLALDGLGAAGPASLAGPHASPLVSLVDGDGGVRAWRLGADAQELPSPGRGDGVALHLAGDRPIGLLLSPVGAVLVALGPAGWEVVRDVDGTDGATRVLAVSGADPEFLVEVPGGVVLVDGGGQVRP